MNNIDVSIVIVSWNVGHFVKECLLSILTNKEAAYEIIIVDNASEDNTVEYIERYWSSVILIVNEKNLGFAHANNQGIQIARGRYIVLLNPDTKVVGSAIDTIVEFMDSQPEVGLAGGKLLNTDGTLQPSLREFPNPMRDFLYISGLTTVLRAIERRWLQPRPSKNTDTSEWRYHDGYVNGAFLIIPRNIVVEIGLLDERYPLYFEEVDLCYRVLGNGHRIAYYPSAEVIHYGGQSSSQIGAKSHRLYIMSLFLYYRKFYSVSRVRKARLAVFLGAGLRFFFFSLGSIGSAKAFSRHISTCFTLTRAACSRLASDSKALPLNHNTD